MGGAKTIIFPDQYWNIFYFLRTYYRIKYTCVPKRAKKIYTTGGGRFYVQKIAIKATAMRRTGNAKRYPPNTGGGE